MFRIITTIKSMKKLYIGIALGICVTILFSSQYSNYSVDKAIASAHQTEGILVFTDADPKMSHDTLGRIDLGFVSGTQYLQIRDQLLKKVAKTYPNADGIILHFDNRGLDYCYAIQMR